jgi:hypothetical protein
MARLIDTMDEKQMWRSWMNSRLTLRQWFKEMCQPLVLATDCVTDIKLKQERENNEDKDL